MHLDALNQTDQTLLDGFPAVESQRFRAQQAELKVVGLFAGIGGIEEGFRQAGHKSVLLCENDSAAQHVLKQRFKKTPVCDDVRELQSLPACDVVTAGFPCQDLSPAGRCAGIDGDESGLVSSVFRLLRDRRKSPTWLLLENVPFMLRLNKGRAIEAIVEQLENMGWNWAYRTIDTKAFGLPQRRKRVLLLASKSEDPRPYLLASDATPRTLVTRANHACGFYWTEGNTGIGWAIDSIPPLKGGSGVGIPSPPAIWFPKRRLIATPTIGDAERLQGFSRGWTEAATKTSRGARLRWKLVGNAVSVPVAKWIAERLSKSLNPYDPNGDTRMVSGQSWPDAAWGRPTGRFASDATSWPVQLEHQHLASFLSRSVNSLSLRATNGFYTRLQASGLRHEAEFALDLAYHIDRMKDANR